MTHDWVEFVRVMISHHTFNVLDDSTELTGTNAIVKSHDLVVLMLECEDHFKLLHHRDLEWPKHINGILKTVGTLADFLEKA